MSSLNKKAYFIIVFAVVVGVSSLIYLKFSGRFVMPCKEGQPSVTPNQKPYSTGPQVKRQQTVETSRSAATSVEKLKAPPIQPDYVLLPLHKKKSLERLALDQATALKRWEDRLAIYIAEEAKERVKTTPVTAIEQEEVLELFSSLDPEAKLESINHAVNLLPDETVSVINGILFDTTQPGEVIAVIFHDLLNRDESIKNPMMEEIVKNKAHPMYVESARILDIVKPDEGQ